MSTHDIHRSVTLERVIEAADEDDQNGLCIGCGAGTSGIEPDAERYRCDECGREAVYGAAQLIICGLYRDEDEGAATDRQQSAGRQATAR